MSSLVRKYWFLTLGSLLFFASVSLAQSPVNMVLTGVNPTGYNLDGVYTSPYQATINGVSATVICDDFADGSNIGESWQATATNLATVGNSTAAKWDPFIGVSEQTLYDQVAWLSTQLLAASGNAELQADIGFAIWQATCTESTGVNIGNQCSASNLPFAGLSGTDLSTAQSYLTLAENQPYTAGEFSNFTIYTPVSGTSNPPQEFIVETPESSTAVMLSADLFGLIGLAFVFRRRLLRPITL